MKLIDKEALLLALRKKRYSKQSLDLIESQPVVDAIPVKWIKQYWDIHKVDNMTIWNMLNAWEKENEKDI